MPRRTPPPLLAALVAAALPGALPAQTVDDGVVLPARFGYAMVAYGVDRWDRYWEGTRLRDNANIGTLTTRTVGLGFGYGLTDRLTLVASLPYVRTEASDGVLQGQRGMQDLTVAVKLRALQGRTAGGTAFQALLTAGAAAPTTDYTPDFLPMSIGLASRRAMLRAAVRAEGRAGWFADAGAGHTWRSTVTLDRPAYFTDDRLVLSDEVAMPDVVDWSATAGWQARGLRVPVTLAGQRTLGGGDIRRQDMPFVSNRMDFTRVQAQAAYQIPGVALDAFVGGSRVLAGRNVGRSSQLFAGVVGVFRL
ncbi:hypothetical protein [Roseisolibacter sp. H3M3-2]|uniref:hypothetical protein n=1 Tax=Roseisolibacter sp. H3M3-2 TaxID=3031323 RepID=UPI0023DB76B9|nr:hypothetical protein [Roseisolibacter sp. H3M3-2]MDF1503643.1 hypothetical protein [Roseisolibacter sp. H3M3-2]